MGLFNKLGALFGSAQTKSRPNDLVYAGKVAKYKGLHQRIKESMATCDVWVVAHFAQSLEEVKQALTVMGIDYVEIHGRPPAHASSPRGIHLISAENFSKNAESSWLNEQPKLFLVAEHFPLPDIDQALVDKINELAPNTEICFYMHFDEPFFDHAAGGKGNSVKEMLLKMGFDGKEDGLEHPLLSRSILAAQQRIAQKVVVNQPAVSQEKWFEKNL